MQAVRTADRGALSQEEQAEWVRLIDELSSKRQLLAVAKSVEEKLDKPGALEFLCRMWHEEERERRRREKWLMPGAISLCLVLSLLMLGFAIWTLIGMLRHSPGPEGIGPIIALLPPFAALSVLYFMLKQQRQRALAFLLTSSRTRPPAALLIDALHFGEFSQATRTRLAEMLPRYQDADAPVLDDNQHRTLVNQLRSGLSKRTHPAGSYFTQADAAFLAGVVRYFERESLSGKHVPKEVRKLLSHFVETKPKLNTPLQWRIVQTAAESYLLCVGG
ncbi:MAG: hypothetical protein H8F28_13230 [Fibrella sp.]|nr:hypothetical protein [Armatimonadota bacterium]